VWTNDSANLTTAPSDRSFAGFAYQPYGDELILYGGDPDPRGGSTARFNDTWVFKVSRSVDISANRSAADAGVAVHFRGFVSGLNGSVSWNWSFGDGTYDNDTIANVSHSFTTPDRYSVVATATNGTGVTASSSYQIEVYEALSARPRVTPIEADAPVQFTFHANATGGAPLLSYNWSFSDGYNNTSASGDHTITTAGSYNLTLTIVDGGGGRYTTNWSLTVFPTLGGTVSVEPTVGIVPFLVNATWTPTGGDPPPNATWYFGTGTSEYGLSTNFTYRTPHLYTVQFNGTDAQSGALHDQFTVSAFAPITGAINMTRKVGVAPFDDTFTALASGGGGGYSYRWDFGDGTGNGSGYTVSHTFGTTGNYTVQLVVTDQYGFTSAVIEATVSVVARLSALVSAPNATGVAPFQVNFTAVALGGFGPLSYTWQFGDGGIASGVVDVNHTYLTAGTFDATVQVSDTLGEVATGRLNITVVTPLRATLDVSPSVTNTTTPVTFSVIGQYGKSPYTYAWGGLPSGCAFGDVVGGSCHPGTVGNFSVWVVVSDTLGEHVNTTATLEVQASASTRPPPPNTYNNATASPDWLLYGVAIALAVLVIAVLVVWRTRRSPPTGPESSAEPADATVPAEEAPGVYPSAPEPEAPSPPESAN
jgi:PKD repeat protein